ncbi:MAG: radical SAM protein [Oscillospiraceae bacterium]|nr:radical SAM protein [Oscillospiraceae bacterium]
MKNIYLIQPNNVISGKVYFPYAVGAIASYAWQFDEIKREYRLCDFIYKKDPVEDVCATFKEPFFVGFSCYMWNIDYNLDLAKRIKQKWPECIIAFGGQQVPDDTGLLEQYEFIDILMHGEGEQTFYNLLMCFSSDNDLSRLSNISYRKDGTPTHLPRKIYRDVSSYPSPYSTGLFDCILADGRRQGLDFDAVLETNRGCPYSCIYCYWAGTENNFRIFPVERVMADIAWFAENKISFVICADSNFGILDRDNDIADYIVHCKKTFGYPQKFETAAAKNKDDIVFDIHKKLNDADMCCGISVAVQSFSPTVLEIIGRKNLSLDNYAQQLEKYRNEEMSTYTDFILALPGETYQSFCEGLFRALEAGQHDSINIHPCEVLPNTILYSAELREKYQIRTVRGLYQDHTKYDSDSSTNSSHAELIVSTSTLNEQEWCRALRLGTCVQSIHSFGLLKFIAIYLRKAQGVSYYDFYMNLYKWIESESGFLKAVCDDVFENLDRFVSGKGSLCYYNPTFSDSYLYFREGLFLCCAEKLDRFYDDVKAYISQYFSDDELYADLLKYQTAKVLRIGDPALVLHLEYDWQEYFSDIFDSAYLTPIKRKTVLVAEKSDVDNWSDYTYQKIWFGKRENKMLRRFKYAPDNP